MSSKLYGEVANNKLTRVVRRVLTDTALTEATQAPVGGVKLYEGELTLDLAAPGDGKTGATTAKAKEWIVIPGTTGETAQLQLGDLEYKIVNRSETLSAVAGTYIIWIRIHNEWRIIWADC